jgi:hypothetical protein
MLKLQILQLVDNKVLTLTALMQLLPTKYGWLVGVCFSSDAPLSRLCKQTYVLPA